MCFVNNVSPEYHGNVHSIAVHWHWVRKDDTDDEDMNVCSASFNMFSFQTDTAVFCQFNVHCVKNAEKLTNNKTKLKTMPEWIFFGVTFVSVVFLVESCIYLCIYLLLLCAFVSYRNMHE